MRQTRWTLLVELSRLWGRKTGTFYISGDGERRAEAIPFLLRMKRGQAEFLIGFDS